MVAFPDYLNPPVVEVAIGTQFAPLRDLSAAHIGLYWSAIRQTFSKIEEQPPIGHLVEGFAEQPREAVPGLVITTGPPDLPRNWFIDSTGGRLIQLQRDRFLHNWRKVKPEDAYPRYPDVREGFFRYWEGFCQFLSREGLQAPQVDQCELTYVNHVRKGEGWDTFADIRRVLTCLDWRTRSGFLPVPENLRASFRFALPNQRGRLYAEVASVRLSIDNSLALRFILTARGRPADPVDQKTIGDWFDLAHEWIVRGFADSVSEDTDTLWGKKA